MENKIEDLKRIFLYSFFIAIFVYFGLMTKFYFGLDSSEHLPNTIYKIYIAHSRYVLAFLSYIFPYAILYSYSLQIAILLLAVVGTLITYDLKMNLYSKILFSVLFVSYPIFVYSFYFSFSAGIGMMYLSLSVMSLILFDRALYNNKKSLLYFIVYVFGCLISLFSYQVMLLFLVCIVIFRGIVIFNEKEDFRFIVKYYLIFAFGTVVSILLWYITLKLIGYQYGGHFSRMVNYETYSFTSNLSYILQKSVGLINNYEINIIGFIALILSILFYIVNGSKNINILFMSTMFIILYLASNSAQLMFSVISAERIDMSMSVGFAGIITIAYIFASKLNDKYAKIIFGIIGAGIVFYNTGVINKVSMASYLTYENDKTISARILDNIYDVVPDAFNNPQNYKLAIVGVLRNMDNNHVLRYASREVGTSGLTWYEEYRVYNFLRYMGLPEIKMLKIGDNELKSLYDKIETMELFPSKKSVVVEDNIIIVNLGKRGMIRNYLNKIEENMKNIKKVNYGAVINNSDENYLYKGWYGSEKTHIWGRKNTEIFLPLSKEISRDKDLTIMVEGFAFFNTNGTMQKITFMVDDKVLKEYDVYVDNNVNNFIVNIPQEYLQDEIKLKIQTSYESSPKKEGTGNDGRMLGFALRNIKILPYSDK